MVTERNWRIELYIYHQEIGLPKECWPGVHQHAAIAMRWWGKSPDEAVKDAKRFACWWKRSMRWHWLPKPLKALVIGKEPQP